ncbi:uncharacterized protein EV422DRAFT_263036 [Fimicolochytrium jonesii]|uniref:uncharacterized protein n=1 Tax=Fimicolochytrium jonesii TaxID=1396493 RepID=UPI0022FDEE67|nr:uncharacterized protein EV422DRAFT_263036 [Fimicolochytrium jonesii]KAI8817059.1 hypothetical protein EV422DRAFT_263036 [Fimicolochytrium jonesii]
MASAIESPESIMVPNLPFEVIGEIAKHSSPGNLNKLVRVCRQWHDSLIRNLYTSVTISKEPKLRVFYDTLSEHRNRRAWISKLEIPIVDFEVPGDEKYSNVLLSAVLPWCTSVREFHIIYFAADSPPECVLRHVTISLLHGHLYIDLNNIPLYETIDPNQWIYNTPLRPLIKKLINCAAPQLLSAEFQRGNMCRSAFPPSFPKLVTLTIGDGPLWSGIHSMNWETNYLRRLFPSLVEARLSRALILFQKVHFPDTVKVSEIKHKRPE